MLTIRDEQMRALAKGCERNALSMIAADLRRRHPNLLKRSQRKADAIVEVAASWARLRGQNDRALIAVAAGLIAAFGDPPWRASWAYALRDIHLTPDEARETFIAQATEALDAAERAAKDGG